MLNVIRGKVHRAQRVVLYGQEGVGKTTLAAGFPHPLILDTEDGSHHLDVDRVPIATLGELTSTLDELQGMAQQNACEYATVIIDTADQLWHMCAVAVCEENRWKSIEAPGYGKGYAQASERFISLLSRLDALVRLGVSVVVVCHAKIQRVSPPDTAEFTKYAIKVSAPSSQAEVAREKLKEWCDVLLFCRFDITVAQTEGKAKSAVRVIATTSAPTWEAKNRMGLPDSLPMEAAALAPIWGGGVEQAKPEPTHAPAPADRPESAQPDTAAAPQAAASVLDELTDEDKALLTDFFVVKGYLKEGQGLDALPAHVAQAFNLRPGAALAKAKAWKGGEA